MFSLHLRQIAGVLTVVALGLGVSSCSDTVREGRSPAYLIVEQLEAASGADQEDFSHELSSDVATNGTRFEDLGRATFSLALKNIGSPGQSTAPTVNNFITVTRYHVEFRRTDGRNTPGVDVPFAFDGAGTITVGDSATTLGFVLVRAQSKFEPPLSRPRGGGGALLNLDDCRCHVLRKGPGRQRRHGHGLNQRELCGLGRPVDPAGGSSGGEEETSHDPVTIRRPRASRPRSSARARPRRSNRRAHRPVRARDVAEPVGHARHAHPGR